MKIAFIPNRKLMFALNVDPEKGIDCLTRVTSSKEVFIHTSIDNCDCFERGQAAVMELTEEDKNSFTHVLLVEPKVNFQYIQNCLGHKFKEYPLKFWIFD